MSKVEGMNFCAMKIRLLCCDNSHEVIEIQKFSESNIMFCKKTIRPQSQLFVRKWNSKKCQFWCLGTIGQFWVRSNRNVLPPLLGTLQDGTCRLSFVVSHAWVYFQACQDCHRCLQQLLNGSSNRNVLPPQPQIPLDSTTQLTMW